MRLAIVEGIVRAHSYLRHQPSICPTSNIISDIILSSIKALRIDAAGIDVLFAAARDDAAVRAHEKK